MPKLAANQLPYVLLDDPNLVGQGAYWRIDPQPEATHLLLGRLGLGGPHELNCNPGSIVFLIQGSLRLSVVQPLTPPTDVELAQGEGYRFSSETQAQAICHSEVLIAVLRAGGPGGHPITNRPPQPNAGPGQ